MHKFALQHIEEIHGTIRFYKLLIDGKCPFDEFTYTITTEGNLKNQLERIQTRMLAISQIQSLPSGKFRALKGCKDAYAEYEIKTHDLRVYLFKEEKTGNIIVWGGKKGTQQADIKYFRNLKKQYIQSKTQAP